MPEFARENPQSFWEAADAFERKNGRAYTELQIALPRELAPEERNAAGPRVTAKRAVGRPLRLHIGRTYAFGQRQHRAAAHAPDVLGTHGGLERLVPAS